MQLMFSDQIKAAWLQHGWDPADLKYFVMSDLGPDPTDAGDVITIPDPPAPPPAPATTPPVLVPGKSFSIEDLEKARQEERDKLYKRIEKSESELKEIATDYKARKKAEEDARKEAERLAEEKAKDEMSFKDLLEKKEADWTNRFSTLQDEVARKDAVLEAERRYNELQRYKAHRMTEMENEIMPQLRDLVNGNTEEEIELSLAIMAERTGSILGEISQQFVNAPRPMAASLSQPPGPMDNETQYKSYSADEIRNMDMATYAQNRDRLLGAASQKARNGGLYR